MRHACTLLASLACLWPTASAQIGGDGRDGAFTPTGAVVLDTSKNGGKFYFTRISIPVTATVDIAGTNPAVLHSQGPVEIAGVLRTDGVDGNGGKGAPGGAGGFAGGDGGVYIASDGLGPGGGKGAISLPNGDPRSGGSGGHATPGKSGFNGGGAGGGGVVVILADGPIKVSGTITANGGTAWVYTTLNKHHTGGAGAGGSILLRSLQRLEVAAGARVSAVGGMLWPPKFHYLGRFGGDGRVRLDAYAAAPIVNGNVEPTPSIVELPELTETIPPRISGVFGLSSASVPNDILAVFLSKNGARVPIPPLGTLELDLTAGFIFAGAMVVPAGGVDPIARVVFPVQANSQLVGLRVHAQAINLVTATSRPRLTNGVVTVITN